MQLWTPPAVISLALLVGCWGGESPRPGTEEPSDSSWEPVSGSRLEARFLVGDDGSRIFYSWFDTARGEYCRVARGQNGRHFCFPSSNPAVYSDARCQQAVGQHLECAFRYTGVARGDRRCGNETLTLWQEGDALALPSRYRFSNDVCAGPDISEGGQFVSLTTRLTDNTFLGGDARLARADLRLGPRVIRFEDGAVAPFEMYDSSQGRACVQVETVRGTRCIPENAVYLGLNGPFYEDRACTEPVAHAYAPACLRPTVALRAETVNGCARITEAYRPGPRLDPRLVFSGTDCQTGLIIPGHFYELGERIDLGTFPELKLRERGSGRIRVRTFSAADDVSIPPLGQHLFDSQLGLECQVAVAGDGLLRCLPLQGPSLIEGEMNAAGFADADCRRPLARLNATTCTGATPAMAGVARASQKRCLDPSATGPGSRDDRQPGRWDIYRLGRRHEGELFFRTSGSCQAGPAPPGDEFFEMEELLAPDTFVAFREG